MDSLTQTHTQCHLVVSSTQVVRLLSRPFIYQKTRKANERRKLDQTRKGFRVGATCSSGRCCTLRDLLKPCVVGKLFKQYIADPRHEVKKKKKLKICTAVLLARASLPLLWCDRVTDALRPRLFVGVCMCT